MNTILPYDNNLEDMVLGTLIHNPGHIDIISEYIANDNVFNTTRAKHLWHLLNKLKLNGEHIDLITVCSHLTQEHQRYGLNKIYIVDITTDTCLKEQSTVYARRMYEHYLLREVIVKTQNIQQMAKENKSETFDVLNSTHNLIGRLIELKPDKKFDIESEVMEAIESITSTESKLVRTDYPDIDRFSGGLTRGEITIIGGRPGHGKSTFLINLLSHFLGSGQRVLLFNRELTNVEVLKKIITLESQKLSYTNVRKGVYDDVSIKELERVKTLITKKYSEENFKMFDNIRDLPKTINEIKKFKPDVVLDDYIQLVNLGTRDDSRLDRRLQLEKLVSDYKWALKETKCVGVLASQLNRALETRGDARPRLSDLAESGAIEQIAENVFFVYYKYKTSGRPEDRKDIMIIASKVRYGDSGDVMLKYDGDHVIMYDPRGIVPDRLVKEVENEKLPF
jgi:replicative DNA helicase